MNVYLYATCLSDMLNRQIQKSAKTLLEKAGLKVHVLAGATCCGQPAYNAGHRSAAKKVAMQQLSIFKEDWPIILPSASCAAMMKYHYTKLFEDEKDTFEQVLKLKRKVYEWSAFYQSLSPALIDKGAAIKVFCHPSCHGIREMQQHQVAFSLLDSLEHVQLLHLPHEHECCGFGGTFSIKHSSISTAMADRKIDELSKLITSHGLSRLVGADYSCLMHLQGRMQRLGINIEVQHLACFLEQRL